MSDTENWARWLVGLTMSDETHVGIFLIISVPNCLLSQEARGSSSPYFLHTHMYTIG